MILFVISSLGHSQISIEICDNALDDDGDGYIDLNDPDCDCPLLEPRSLIPNPSFEETECCPSNFSQMHCATTWIQASEATTDYINRCGWYGWPEFPPPEPLPDGDGSIGFRDGRNFMQNAEPNWKEYAGACLLSPLRAGILYRFEFYLGFSNMENSPPIDITFFGSTDCENLPFGIGNSAFGCPTNGPGWQYLGTKRVSGVNEWRKVYLEVKPTVDIFAIAIGPGCREIMSDVNLYYFFDNLILAEQSEFELVITDQNHPCSPNYSLHMPNLPGSSLQWYRNGIALNNENSPQLSQIPEDGVYEVVVIDSTGCRVTRSFDRVIPVFNSVQQEVICEGELFTFQTYSYDQPGSYTHLLSSEYGCDSIVTIDLEVQTDFPYPASRKILEGEILSLGDYTFDEAGEYEVALMSQYGCDSTVILTLEYYNLFLPNVFTPNDDGINDLFKISADDDLIRVEDMAVFNRWGQSVFRSNSVQSDQRFPAWNGRSNGEIVPSGVYTYIIEVVMSDGKNRVVKGDVTLLR